MKNVCDNAVFSVCTSAKEKKTLANNKLNVNNASNLDLFFSLIIVRPVCKRKLAYVANSKNFHFIHD